MVRKSKSICHSKSRTPSPSPLTSPSHSKSLIFKQEVEKENTRPTIENLNTPDNSSLEPPEVQTLIHKLQGFSISQE